MSNYDPFADCAFEPEPERITAGGDDSESAARLREFLANPRNPRAAQKPDIELGDIVKLWEPYKPVLCNAVSDRLIRKQVEGEGEPIERIRRHQAWPGFTHGIVVEILSHERGPGSPVRNVSLHMYDPETGLVYMGPNDIPTYVDFHVCSFWLYKRARTQGYHPESQPAQPAEE